VNGTNPLSDFHPVVRRWFEKTFHEPSPPQRQGWPSISAGQNTLILAPTGSGKTLAAFLWGINHLVEQHLREDLPKGVRILYISPLKALNNDIQRNLELPLTGIRKEAVDEHIELPTLRTAVRTGDTPQRERAAMLRNPPDILITTPESLYLMLTSTKARHIFRTVQYVIVDEIHSVCNNKRGVHLSLSLERLSALAEQEFLRIGLSATQRPLETIAAFLGGLHWRDGRLEQRPVTIVDAGSRKEMDLRVECAVADFSVLPQESVWPMIFSDLLGLIRNHRTTLIFVNNRRLAERVAAKLNEMISGEEDLPAVSGRNFSLYAVPVVLHGKREGENLTSRETLREDLVKAYHGSMSREAREQMETDLKSGNLRALVATSSLELGIDIGSIDLVVQIQSPKGVARGLQRVGRSGHLVTATSKGRILPTYREDLVEAAVVARAMLEHDVEMTAIPENCLDVLAQQIVAMVSVDEWEVDELLDLVRQSYCYRSLPESLFTNVLQMLAGRYQHEAFRELRARISWDKVHNRLMPLPGSNRLAITSGGTIADRGYYGVYLEDGKTKVGEVDEEFIFESRAGDTFILGTNVWRMVAIDANRVTVTPAPGQPARMPFWRGEGVGRTFALSTMVGAFRRELGKRIESPEGLSWIHGHFPVDSRSAWNILEYFRRQRDATREIPHDRLIIIEGFRDEIGDPRIVIHSGFGRRVNGLLGMVASRRLHAMAGVESQMLYNDDGILLRCPDLDEPPLSLLDNLTVRESHDIVLDEVLLSPLFGGQFRMNAARALLMPKVAPGKRTPLWLQRLRAGDLLQVARRFDDFPIVMETLREVLHDILDFEHFTQVVREIEQSTIRLRPVRTEIPSPFAASLLFDFIAVYMYEWDQPKADKLSQYLAINREVLSEIVDLDSMKSLIRPEAVASVVGNLQRTAEGAKARSPAELLELLLRLGDLSEEEVRERCDTNDLQYLAELAHDGRAVMLPVNGEPRWIAGEEEALYSQLDKEGSLSIVVERYLHTHGPVTARQLAGRYGWTISNVENVLERLSHSSPVTRGHFLPDTPSASNQAEWAYRPNIEKIHRQTIVILRKEIKPSSLAEYTSFLQHWQRVYPDKRDEGVEALEARIDQLHSLPLPAEIWERDILRQRVRTYSPDLLSRTMARGSFVWVGAGSGKLCAIPRGEGNVFLPAPAPDLLPSLNEPATRIHRYLSEHGASFFTDIRTGTHLSLAALNNGIAELFWKGIITNDIFHELLGIKRLARVDGDTPLEPITMVIPPRNLLRGRLMRGTRAALKQVPGWSGRWSLVRQRGVMGEPVPVDEQAARQAAVLLERYGIVARELFRREDLLPWPLVATEFQRMEMRGEIRRGYFVEGLSGMQYALPGAVEEIRRARSEMPRRPEVLLLNACDPANPYGPGIDMGTSGAILRNVRFARLPGNYLAFLQGIPVLLIENSGSRISSLGETDSAILTRAMKPFMELLDLPSPLRPFREIVVEYCDGIRPTISPMEPVLRGLGFQADRNQTMRYDRYL
jgi:ATP-dependent helicase Lhr and Lhr-like helicase